MTVQDLDLLTLSDVSTLLRCSRRMWVEGDKV